MKRWGILLLTVVLLAVCIVGCGKTPNTDDDLPPDVSVDILPLLTPEDVWNASGIKVGEPQDSEEGAVAYFSEDTFSTVYVAAQETTRAAFDTMKENLVLAGTVVDAPNLGDVAFWCEAQCSLIVYANGKTIDVQVTYATDRPNDSLLAARQIAALLIEKM